VVGVAGEWNIAAGQVGEAHMKQSDDAPKGGGGRPGSALVPDDPGLSGELLRCRQEVERWEWFFENSVDILCLCSFDGELRRVNRAFERALGYSREQLLAQPFWDLIHPDDIERTRH
jgi:PAS domain-containing protein